MDRNPRDRVEQMKVFFNVKKDKDLAAMLGISSGMISQWKSKGFSKTYENLFDSIFDEISCCEHSRRKGLSFCGTCGVKIKKGES